MYPITKKDKEEPRFELVHHTRYKISDIASYQLPEISTKTLNPGIDATDRDNKGNNFSDSKDSPNFTRPSSNTWNKSTSNRDGSKFSFENHIRDQRSPGKPSVEGSERKKSLHFAHTPNVRPAMANQAATEQLNRLFDDVKKTRDGMDARRDSYIDSSTCKEHGGLYARRPSSDVLRKGSVGANRKSSTSSNADRRGSMGERFLTGEKRFVLNGNGVERRRSSVLSSIGKPAFDERRSSSGSYFSDRKFSNASSQGSTLFPERRSNSIAQLSDLNPKRISLSTIIPGPNNNTNNRRGSMAALDLRRASLNHNLGDRRSSISPSLSPASSRQGSPAGDRNDRKCSSNSLFGNDRRTSINGNGSLSTSRPMTLGSPRVSPRRELVASPRPNKSDGSNSGVVLRKSSGDSTSNSMAFQRDSLDLDHLPGINRLSLYDSSILEEDELSSSPGKSFGSPPKSTSPIRSISPNRRLSRETESSTPLNSSAVRDISPSSRRPSSDYTSSSVSSNGTRRPSGSRSPLRTTPPRSTPPRSTPPRVTPPRTSPGSTPFVPIKYNDTLTSSFLSPGREKRVSPSREFCAITGSRASPPRFVDSHPKRTSIFRKRSESDERGPLDDLFMRRYSQRFSPPPVNSSHDYTKTKGSGSDTGSTTTTNSKAQFVAVTRLEDAQAVRCAEFHPSGLWYAVGSNSKTLRVCQYPQDINTASSSVRADSSYQPTVTLKRTKHHRGSIYCLAWSPMGDLLATASNDKTVKLLPFDADNCAVHGEEVELTMHDGTVRDLCFVEDSGNKSSLLISGGAGDCKIYVTDTATGTAFQALSGHTGHILSLYTWGGAVFVSGSQDRSVRFWDLRTRGCVNVITPMATPTKAGSVVASVCVDPTGRLLVSGHEDSLCCLYDIRGAREIQSFRPHTSDVRSLRFSPSAYYLLSGGYDNKLVLTDMQGDLTQTLPSVLVAEHEDKVISGRWHPSEFTFISTSADRTCTLWALPPV